MSQSVFLLLSMLLVEGRGCNYCVNNLLRGIKHVNEKYMFREVFPKDYKITHHYNDSLLDGSGTCHMLSEAYMLSRSWSQLCNNLWEQNYQYKIIKELKECLESITKETFLETPDLSVFPPVSSTPEALLALSSTFLSRWLKHQCPSPKERCEFPLPPSFKEERETSTPASFPTTGGRVEGGKRQQRSGAPATSLAASTHLPVSYIFWCFPLLWAVL